MIINFFKDPWKHIIIDDTFDSDLFVGLKKEIETEFLKHSSQNSSVWFLKEGNASVLTVGNPGTITVIPQSSYLGMAFKSFSIYNSKILDFFDSKRTSSIISEKAEISITNNKVENIHDESLSKVCSYITYISPEQSTGTHLFNHTKRYVKTVKWVPNRTLVFCPIDSVTWHNFIAGEERRITFSRFIEREIVK